MSERAAACGARSGPAGTGVSGRALPARSERKGTSMRSIIYLVGLVVIVLAIIQLVA